MTEAVVDVLEAVKVEEENGKLLLRYALEIGEGTSEIQRMVISRLETGLR